MSEAVEKPVVAILVSGFWGAAALMTIGQFQLGFETAGGCGACSILLMVVARIIDAVKGQHKPSPDEQSTDSGIDRVD